MLYIRQLSLVGVQRLAPTLSEYVLKTVQMTKAAMAT